MTNKGCHSAALFFCKESNMTGDGEIQPVEGVNSLDDAADALLASETGDDASDESGDDDEDEQVEATEDEESEDENESEGEDDGTTFTIKVNGKELEVTKAEAIELAQKGADYTAKTMAVAEERKAVEAERETVKQVRQQHEQTLQQSYGMAQALEAFLYQQVGQPPDISLLHEHGSETYIAHKEQYEHRKALLEQARAASAHLQQEQAQQRHAWIMQEAERTERALKDTLPGWSDETLDQLAEYAGKHGLNPQSVDVAFVQKGFWEVLQKAKAYEAIQAKKAEMKPKQTLAKVAKPSAVNQSAKASERMKREEAFRKSPSVDSLAEFLR